ncbi:MAG: hypothetical protein OEW75_10855, partial [Cyclobacteriaceae bacterium]|nr:hypothetical protein [Cyclobacteriaceae bacterium]
LSALILILIFNSFYANNQLGYSYTKEIDIFTSSIMSFVFLAGVMTSFYLLYGKMGYAFFTVKQNENELKLLNEEIQENTKEMENKNAIIRSINQKLFNLNEKLNFTNENQELIIEERTAKLEQQNKVLIEYAYINSHLMRAPLARILGLSALLENQHAELKGSELFKALVQSSEELDSIIKKVSDILYEGNEISREDLESIKIKLKDQDNWPDNIE